MLSAGLPFSCQMAQTSGRFSAEILKPRRLRPGAVVGLVAPASPPMGDKAFEKAFKNLNDLGFQVKPAPHLYARYGHLAGRDEERLSDLHAAFADPEVEAVWCLRGGYGTPRLLPRLNFDLIRRNPKPLIGYSDITALHLSIQQQTGLVTFHGPLAFSEYPEDTLAYLRAMVMEPVEKLEVIAPSPDGVFEKEEFRPFVITPGRVRGRLTGGNMSLLATLVGTPHAPVFGGKLVFLEDVDEQPYRVDRLFTQLLQATDLADAAGIALGVFSNCKPKENTPSLSLTETLRDRLGNLGIPAFYGFPFGHIDNQMTVPYGIMAELDTERRSLTILETAVE